MSRAVLIATVALMLGGTVAEAQDRMQRPDNAGRPDRPGKPGNGPSPGGPNRPGGGLPPGAGNKLPPGYPGSIGGPAVQPPRPGRPEVQPPRPGNGGPQIQPPRPGRPDVRPPRPQPPRPGIGRPPHGGGNWHRPPVYRPGWNYPRGYAYRRYATGLILPTIFLSSAYYFSDYNTLGLYPPPKGYRWVRYGPDLLLVRRKNGRIKEVYYNVFR